MDSPLEMDSPVAAKPVLAIDLDDTLGGFIPSLIDFHNEAYNTNLKIEDFHSYDFHEVWGGTPEEAIQKMEKFFESEHFKSRLKPLPGAKRTLLQLKRSFDLQIVTSRQHFLEEATKEWLGKFYPDIFSCVLFGNHYGVTGEKRSKPDMCKDINAVALVDDSLRYARHMSEAGIPCVLLGEYAWNGGLKNGEGGVEDQPLPDRVVRVAGWKRVRSALSALGVRGEGPNQPRVVSVSASKNASFFANLAKKRLETDEQVVLRALEKAMLNAVDATQMLVRQNIASVKNTTTSFTELVYGRRSCLEVLLQKTQMYSEFLEKQKQQEIINDQDNEVVAEES